MISLIEPGNVPGVGTFYDFFARLWAAPTVNVKPRLFPKTPMDSEKWKLIYKRRTTVERTNKREKVDYKLESGRHRSTKMWYVRIYGIMMCQHMDAWYSHQKEDLRDLKQFIFSPAA